MIEHEIEELLGVYALDAVDAEERVEIEEHLAICPRCRAEVAAHREAAALLANTGATAPEGLWDRIASELSPEIPELALRSKKLIAHLPRIRNDRRRRSWAYVGAMVAAAAVTLVIALLSLQVANLNRAVHPGGSAVNSVLSHQHRTILLTSADHKLNATIALAPDGNAYWVRSNLAQLPKSETYQLWTIVRGATVVSLGVLGPNPRTSTGLRLESNMTRLMVTVEPEGGTPAPTTRPLISATV